jgi:protocatechuate 3,4-dioxygenase beta subunit
MTHWDYAPAKLEVTLTDPNVVDYKEIVLQKGLEIQGYAEYLDGVPAGDLDIGAEPDWWHSWNVPESYPADSNGYFTLKYILPGTYSISAGFPPDEDGSRRARSVMETQLPPENGELLVVAIPEKSPGALASISGKVVFTGETKPGYVSITARSAHFRTGHADLGRDRSGKQRDEFVIDRLEPGVYQLKFSGEGIEQRMVHNVKAPTEGLVVELSARKKVKLRGTVVDKATGEPITEFKIRAYGQRNWVQVSDANGNFDLEVLGAGSRKVQVSAEGFALRISDEIRPDANERTVIELGIGAAIEGTVVDETGAPIEGASISYRYRHSRKESPDAKLITTSDPNGHFMIEEIPVDEHWQWHVFEHPGYAKETTFIELEENHVTEPEIVLKRGGSVEGYVYDHKGRPAANTTLYFMDETQFHYWKENRARLGTATTDELGYYRIDHLPEHMCFAFRGDPDSTRGVSVTSIIPSNDAIRRLDFGGPSRVTGRLIEDGRPLTQAKVVLRGSRAPWETAFEASYVTDSNGRFTFWGVPAGTRYLYYELEGVRGDAKWASLGIRGFQSGVDTDLGDLEIAPAVVMVRIETEQPDERPTSLNVVLQQFRESMLWGSKVGQLLSRSEPNAPYVFDKLMPGTYEVIVSRQTFPTTSIASTSIGRKPEQQAYPEVRRVFELAKGQKELKLNVMIPAGSASLSGKVISNDSNGAERTLVLRSTDQTVTMSVRPSLDGSYRIENLPAGDYTIGGASVAFDRHSVLTEVSLGQGEHKSLDIHIPGPGVSRDGYLVVQVISEDGLPLAGATVWLDRSGQAIYPHFDTDKSKSFAGEAGEYLLHAQHPGFVPVRQRVLMKARSQCNIQQLLEPVVITMNRR